MCLLCVPAQIHLENISQTKLRNSLMKGLLRAPNVLIHIEKLQELLVPKIICL